MPLLQPATPPEPTAYDIPNVGRLPRVTAIISILDKPGLRKWYATHGWDACERMKREAGENGTRVHKAVEDWLGWTLAWDDTPCPEYADAVPPAFMAWVDANVSEILAVERRVHSSAHGFAGTVDAVLRLKDDPNPVLADLKTSKWCATPHAEWSLQLVAYQVALLESAGIATTRRLVLHLPSDRPGELVEHWLPVGAKARADWRAFLACLEVYRWLREGRP